MLLLLHISNISTPLSSLFEHIVEILRYECFVLCVSVCFACERAFVRTVSKYNVYTMCVSCNIYTKIQIAVDISI